MGKQRHARDCMCARAACACACVAQTQVSNHDELMSNFFAQADALALGKTAAECTAEGVPPALVPHKTFKGDRVSMQLLLPSLSPLSLGHLLGSYSTKSEGASFHSHSTERLINWSRYI